MILSNLRSFSNNVAQLLKEVIQHPRVLPRNLDES